MCIKTYQSPKIFISILFIKNTTNSINNQSCAISKHQTLLPSNNRYPTLDSRLIKHLQYYKSYKSHTKHQFKMKFNYVSLIIYLIYPKIFVSTWCLKWKTKPLILMLCSYFSLSFYRYLLEIFIVHFIIIKY